ncbi:LrgB family protein [Balneatrix alpica]|uniref:LrgB family protein n=1 Tax=Balneatrix alpica TaxID=75684 RepID=A0ABV5Z6Z4_9GAMM|nr:LrgB family protein [Balneatrix alpica]
MPVLTELWLYLEASPLLWLTLTLIVFMFSLWLNRLLGNSPLVHPVLVSMAIIISILLVVGVSYDRYFAGAQFVHFLLGPATVALAVPLFDHLAKVREILRLLMVTCITGALTAGLSAAWVAKVMGAQLSTVMSVMPKSVTSPIAMGIAEKIGGYPSLTAGLVLITGAIGCLVAPLLFRLLKIEDHRIQGFVLGVSSHGFGTALAFEVSALAGAFAGLAIGLTGVVSAFLLPLMVGLFQ